MKLSHIKFALVAILGLCAVSAFAGHPIITPDIVAGIGFAGAGFAPMFLGETASIGDIAALVQKQGEAWNEFKTTNDARLKAIEEGKSTADFDAKLAKMDDRFKEIDGAIKDVTLKSQRPVIGEGDEKSAKRVKSFNALLQAEGKSLAAPLSAEAYKAYEDALTAYVRKGADQLTPDQVKAINVGTSSQGGYLIGYAMEAGIERVVGNFSAIRQLASVKSIGAASYKKLVKTSGTTGGTRGGERTSATEGTSPGWSELEFRTGTFLSDQRITSEALEDAVMDVEADLMDEMGREFAEMEGDNFVDGTGLNGPRGFLDYSIVANASYAWGSLGYTASGAASDFATTNPSDKLIDLVHSLKRQYRAGGAWCMNDSTLAAIRKFKDGQGNYLWGMTAPSNLMAGAVGTLLGYPVATDDFMPDVGANAYPIAFADWKRAYYVIDRKGISVLRDPFSAHPYVKFVARKRVGGGIANFEAMKLLKIASL